MIISHSAEINDDNDQSNGQLATLKQHADSLFVVVQSGAIADDDQMSCNICRAVQGLADLVTDSLAIDAERFAEIGSVLSKGGSTRIGIGTASGVDRASGVSKRTMISLLGKEDYDTVAGKAQGLLINITATPDLSLNDFDIATSPFINTVVNDTEVVCGLIYDHEMGDCVRMVVALTGIEDP